MNSKNQPSKDDNANLLRQIDNVDLKLIVDGMEYVVLLKKQPQKQYSTLYVTDCMRRFWLRKVDPQYMSELREELKLTTALSTFIDCFIVSLKNNAALKFSQSEQEAEDQHPNATLSFKLQVGQGLTLETSLEFNIKINSTLDERGYFIILKMFILQLYESKRAQQSQLELKLLDTEKESESEAPQNKKDTKYINSVLDIVPKRDATKDLKHRDIMNPNRRKRKNIGVKLNAPQ